MILTQEEVDAMLHPYEQKLRGARMLLLFETVTNEDDGIEALIMDGNETHSYRVVYRDTDAEEAIGVVFCDTYLDAKRHADNFASKNEN
jgi:hypothetical protein